MVDVFFFGGGVGDANTLQDSRLGVPGMTLQQSGQSRGSPQREFGHILATTDVDQSHLTKHSFFFPSNDRFISVEPAVSWQLMAAKSADRSRRPRQTSRS